MDKVSAFEHTRAWFDFVYENAHTVNHSHTAVYLWLIELCNRLGWPKHFGVPTKESMMSCGVKSYNTYIKCMRDLAECGFIDIVQESKNQYTANVIALLKFDKASFKALDRALLMQGSKQDESSSQSTDSIIKQEKQEKPNKPEKPNKEDLPDFVWHTTIGNNFSDNAKEKWLILCKEKKWKGKSESALRESLNKLLRYEEPFAIDLISNAIASGYQGVVFPNTDELYQQWKLKRTVQKPQQQSETNKKEMVW